MFAKKTSRMLGLSLVLVTVLSLLVGAVQAQDESVIVIGWEQEPEILYPLTTSTFGQLLKGFYMRNVWDWDGNNNPFPVMVEELPTIENGGVTTNADGNTVVTYKLRQDLKWSDGEAVTADDCVFGHRLWTDTTTGTIFRSDYPNVVASVEKVDDFTVIQTFNTPFPDYQSDTVYLHCDIPEHVVAPLMEANGGTVDGLPFFTNGEGVVGYGPYVMTEWRKGEGMTFVRNENFVGTAPGFDRVEVRFITETAQMVNAFETGEIDVAFNWADNLMADYMGVEGGTVVTTPSVYADALWFNIDADGTQNPALKDVNVRKAIVMAINRRANNDALVYEGAPIPEAYDARNWWPEGLNVLQYDPEGAAAMLDAAGWVDTNGNNIRDKDGVEMILRFFTTTRQVRMDYQLTIQADLQAVGIGTQLFAVPGPAVLFASFTNRGIMATSDYDIAIYANSNDPITPNYDPDTFTCAGLPSAENPGGSNFSHFCDPAFDELVASIKVNTDPVSRLEQKHEAVNIFNEATFYAGLYPRNTHYAIATERVTPPELVDIGVLAANWFNHIEYWQPAG